jgi:hypothetical protein
MEISGLIRHNEKQGAEIMKWRNSRKGSLTYVVVITLTMMILFSLSYCNISAPTDSLPSDTSSPASTIGPALIETPNITELPVATDIPAAYPTPLLLSLAPRATIVGEKVMEFSWQWDGTLHEEEGFDLRIWRPEKPFSTIALLRENSLLLDTPPDGFGQYLWQVAVVRIDKESGSKSTLSESPIRSFVWSDVTPTPTLTDTVGHLTEIPTNTLTPTSTLTPSPTPTLIATPIPPSPTPSPTPTIQYQYGPILYEPKPWSVYSMGDTVWFTWERFDLKPDQYYSVRVVLDVEPEAPACIHIQTQNPKEPAKNPEALLKLNCPPGGYYWSVVVATKLPEGSEHEWREDSDKEHRNHFGIGMPHPNTPQGGDAIPPADAPFTP